jgi:hypothetical protein
MEIRFYRTRPRVSILFSFLKRKLRRGLWPRVVKSLNGNLRTPFGDYPPSPRSHWATADKATLAILCY